MSDAESVSEASSAGQGEQNWDDWDEDESEGYQSLFSSARFGSLAEVLQHDEQERGFNLRRYRAQHQLDQVDTIRLINFIRTQVAAGQDPLPALLQPAGSAAWRDDCYLQPVLDEDELMFHDWEEEEAEGAETQAAASGTATAAGGTAGSGDAEVVAALRHENEALQAALEALQALLLQGDEAMQELLAESQQQAAAGSGGSSVAAVAQPAALAAAVAGPAAPAPDAAAQRIDESYFDSYSTFDIHREMLADKVRTEAYRDALEKNPGLVKGATVLDVGCGTGILSMFAARGGAAAVIGIDGSEQIAKFARANVEANGLAATQGGPITIITSKVEQLAALPLPQAADAAIDQHGQQQQQQQPQQQVDVLVSEWMGYALLFESMLDSVLVARDRWLRPGGAVLPDVAQLYVAAAGEGATGLGFWQDVYGFSMKAVHDSLRDDALKRAVVRVVGAQDLISEPAILQRFDLATMSAADQDFTAPFKLTVGAGPQRCHALVVWFDTLFSDRFCSEHPVELCTSPIGPQTHWMQTVLLLKQPVLMAPVALAAEVPDTAISIIGQLSMCRSKQTHRSLDIVVRYSAQYADGSASEEQVVIYGLGVEA